MNSLMRITKTSLVLLLAAPLFIFQNCSDVEFESLAVDSTPPGPNNPSCVELNGGDCLIPPDRPVVGECPDGEPSCIVTIDPVDPKYPKDPEDPTYPEDPEYPGDKVVEVRKAMISTHIQPLQKKLDLLIVIDTSSSLYTEKAAIANGISGFVDGKFDDLQIAVMPAKVNAEYAGLIYKKDDSSVPHVLKSKDYDLSDPDEVFRIQENLYKRLGETLALSDGEAPLYSMYKAISDAERLAFNKDVGFFREDAALAVLMVTDENDWCSRPYYPAGISPVPQSSEVGIFNEYCVDPSGQSLFTYNDIVNLVANEQGDHPFILSGIFYQDPATVPTGNVDEVGYGVLETVAIANGIDSLDYYLPGILDGIAIDLASGNGEHKSPDQITSELSLLSEFVAKNVEFKNNFILTIEDGYSLDPDTIKVFVDGVSVTFNLVVDANGGAPVVIIKQGDQGTTGSVVVIEYSEKKLIMLPAVVSN